jgi:hypothetical protein
MKFLPMLQISVQPLALVPIIFASVGLLLSCLCLFAGHEAGLLEDYAIFTTNVSRFGQDIVQALDDTIANATLVERRWGLEHAPRITAAPELKPRLLGHAADHATKRDVAAVVESYVANEAQASSLQTAEAAAETALEFHLKTGITGIVDIIYHYNLNRTGPHDWYSYHVMTMCWGRYVYANGTNLTIGMDAPPEGCSHNCTAGAPGSTRQVVEGCAKHWTGNPVNLVKGLYIFGIVNTAFSILTGIVAMICFSEKLVQVNVYGSLPGLLCVFAASSATFGTAATGASLLNFLSGAVDAGVAGYQGRKFSILTFAASVLLLLNTILWVLLGYQGGKPGSEAGVGRAGLRASRWVVPFARKKEKEESPERSESQVRIMRQTPNA